MIKSHKSAFTLIEVVVALTIFVGVTALALSGYVYLAKNAHQVDIQSKLNMDGQQAIEQLKMDMRLSSMNQMFYFPAGSPPYEAVSFPIAYDSDGDGIIERDDDGMIIWDETIVYHIRDGTPDELVRTRISPRDNTLLDSQRQSQLNEIVNTGTSSDQNASSKTIFNNLLNWEITPSVGTFNCYASSEKRENISMGYVMLESGSHDFKFAIDGKDTDSSGYKLGLDTLTVSPSYIPREAEDQNISNYSGNKPSKTYQSTYSGKNKLQLNANNGDTFTLTIDNDRWEDTNFGGRYTKSSNTVVTTHYYSISPIDADIVVELDGNEYAWEASAQGSDPVGSDPGTNFNGMVIRTLLKGSNVGGSIISSGTKTKLIFAASPSYPLFIKDVYIAESVYSNSLDMTVNPLSIKQVQFNNSGTLSQATKIAANSRKASDWIDLELDPDKNYIVSYSVDSGATQQRPMMWADNSSDSSTTQIAMINSGYTQQQLAKFGGNWSAIASTDVTVKSPKTFLGLDSAYVSYMEYGTYTSDIIDTKMDTPGSPQYFSWNADLPGNTIMGFRVRSGSNPALNDAASFDTLPIQNAFSTASDVGISLSGRYVQYQVILNSSPAQGLVTPRLKDASVSWKGESRMVEISGLFTKGPDYGNFSLSIDGKGLQSALMVDLEIFENVHGMNSDNRRISSEVKVALTPRNSSL